VCQIVNLKDNYTTPICVFICTATDKTMRLHQSPESVRLPAMSGMSTCMFAPVGTAVGAGAAGVVCWAGWGRPRQAWVPAGPAFSLWGNPAAGPSGQTWGESQALAWERQGSPSVPCGMVGGQTVGCTWGASGLTSWRDPGGTGLAPVIGSETGSHRYSSYNTMSLKCLKFKNKPH